MRDVEGVVVDAAALKLAEDFCIMRVLDQERVALALELIERYGEGVAVFPEGGFFAVAGTRLDFFVCERGVELGFLGFELFQLGEGFGLGRFCLLEGCLCGFDLFAARHVGVGAPEVVDVGISFACSDC